jgi:hypothetical protein
VIRDGEWSKERVSLTVIGLVAIEIADCGSILWKLLGAYSLFLRKVGKGSDPAIETKPII